MKRLTKQLLKIRNQLVFSVAKTNPEFTHDDIAGIFGITRQMVGVILAKNK